MSDQKKSAKVGRNLIRCKTYRQNQTAEFNKARRLRKYLRKHPHQKDAWNALERLAGVLYTAQRKTLGLTDFLATKPS